MVDKDVLHDTISKLVAFEAYSEDVEALILESLKDLMASIPDKRRASYGIVSVIVSYCKTAYKTRPDVYDLALTLYREGKDYRVICVGLGLLSHIGVDQPHKILPLLEEAADHAQWEVKEFVQMFIRKITKKHPEVVQNFLIHLTQSSSASKRRMASEALRPVVENRWIHDQPDFALKVLRHLFHESQDFPRVSVGNCLSDLSRKNPDLILGLVGDLVARQDENAYFIAYRACRNLVKSRPLEVMNLLKIETYKYKNKSYHKKNYI